MITSGSPSPTLGKNIALAYVPPQLSAIGTELYVEIRTQKAKAKVVADAVLQARQKAGGAAQREATRLTFANAGRRGRS